jgi:short-subunit dehydrogenase
MSYALITGASKGIGKAMAEELASRNINLLLVARSEALLDALSVDLATRFHVKTAFLSIDLSAEGAPAHLFNWVQGNGYQVNILINNAGYGLGGAFERYSSDEHLAMMRVNMQVPVALCSLFLPQLKHQQQSYILNIASSAAYQSVPGLSAYAASKAFVRSFSRGLAHELRKTNVSVTVVSPGGTDSDFANRAQVGEKAVKAGEKLNMSAL